MNDFEKKILTEFSEYPIPNAIYADENGIYIVYYGWHTISAYIKHALAEKYKSGFSKKDQLSIKKLTKDLSVKIIDEKERIEVEKYFALYFQCVEILAKEFTRLKKTNNQ